jgi:UDP-glucose 4-epimerase
MKIAITGATGRVGANLALALARAGHEVTGIVNPDSPRARKLDPLGVRVALADLRDTDAVARAVAGAEAIFHLGARIGGPDNLAQFDINLRGTINVLEGAVRRCPGLKRLFFASTDAVIPHSGFIPDPIPEDTAPVHGNMYSWTKYCGELLCLNYHRERGLPVVIGRFPFIIGPGELLDANYFRGLRLCDHAARLQAIEDPTPDQQQAIEALEAGRGDDTWALARNTEDIPYQKHVGDVRDLIDALLLVLEKDECVGLTMNVMGLPLNWGEAVPYLAEKTGKPFVDVRLPGAAMFYEYSLETAQRVLGFTPQHDYRSMIDLALARQRGEDIGWLAP